MGDDVIKLLTRMNGGRLLDCAPNEMTEKSCDSDDVWLFVDESKDNYYFFANFTVTADKENYQLIEEIILRIRNSLKISPSSAYLILLWKVEEVSEKLYHRIMTIEENDMLFKKYVLYFTEEEYFDLKKYVESIDIETITNEYILNEISKTDFKRQNCVQFLIRIYSKIPFWNLSFPHATLEDFEDLVEEKIKTKRKYKDAVSDLRKMVNADSLDSDGIVAKIYSYYMKEE